MHTGQPPDAGAEQSSVCITPVRIMPTDDSAASLGRPFCISVAVPTPCEAVPIETPHATSFEAVPHDRASVTPSPKAPPYTCAHERFFPLFFLSLSLFS